MQPRSSELSFDNTGVLVHARKVHVSSVTSPLSHDAPIQDYRGFHNLVMLLLFVNNLRLVIENYMKYGFLMKLPDSVGLLSDSIKVTCIVLGVCVPVLVILFVEQLCSRWTQPSIKQLNEIENFDDSVSQDSVALFSTPKLRRRKSSSMTTKPSSKASPKKVQGSLVASQKSAVLRWTDILCLAVIAIVPNYYIYNKMNAPVIASLGCFWSVIVLMKMISFILVNGELRAAYENGVSVTEFDQTLAYPNNLTFTNVAYFLMAPTLCYQPSYPRTERFRFGFFLKRVLEAVSLFGMMWFISEQYSTPTLVNSQRHLVEWNLFVLLERTLKLSIPSIYIWLLLFYVFFHAYLNMWAEMLRFADREFYKPWWNASTVAQYWRLWNIPVYTFFKRHIYVPFRIRYPKSPRWIAHSISFFISAIGHEIVIGVPTHIIKGWAFGGMMFQIPLIWLSEVINYYETTHFQPKRRPRKNSVATEEEADAAPKRPGNFGNYLFWLTFCVLGQPLIVLLYYREYYLSEVLGLD